MTTIATPRVNAFDWQLEKCGDPVMIVTHRRSGTHLIIDFVRRQFPASQSWKWPMQNTNRLYLAMGALARGMLPREVARRIIHRPKRPIFKTHSLPTFDLQQGGFEQLVQCAYDRGHVIYSMRDCRAVMASLYAYMQRFDESTRVSPGEFLRQTNPLPEFMLPSHASLSRPAQWAHHVQEWVNQDGVLVMRYEDVLQNPREVLTTMGAHLGMEPAFREPLLPPKFSRTFRARSMRRLHMWPTSTAIISPRAAGVPHSWRELFSADDLDFIWQEAGDVLAAQGYDRSGT